MLATDQSAGTLSVLRVADGALVNRVDLNALTAGEARYPYDLEECEDGWLVSSGYTHRVWYLPWSDPSLPVEESLDRMGSSGTDVGQFSDPVGLAMMPGLGLLLREAYNGGRMQVRPCAAPVAGSLLTPCV